MTISEYKPINKGALVGKFNLLLPSGLLLKECTLFEKEGRHWVGLPQRSYVLNGQTKYQKLVEIPDKEISEKFSAMAVAALREQAPDAFPPDFD